MGEGGSIVRALVFLRIPVYILTTNRLRGFPGFQPFMGLLGSMFPEAQFVITGVLGPGSNAHGPNEFLHIATGERVTASVAFLLALAARHL